MIVGAFEREQLASACGDSLAGHDARSFLQAAHEVLFVVVRKDVLAHPQQFDHHRIRLRNELDDAARRHAREPRHHAVERHVLRDRYMVNQCEREHCIGSRPALQSAPLGLAPALVGRGVRHIQEQRCEGQVLGARAIGRASCRERVYGPV